MLAPDANAIAQFLHGVASGDPLTDRVIIWTRVTPDEQGPIDVDWTLAEDPALLRPAAGGRAIAAAAADYTVKIKADGISSRWIHRTRKKSAASRPP